MRRLSEVAHPPLFLDAGEIPETCVGCHDQRGCHEEIIKSAIPRSDAKRWGGSPMEIISIEWGMQKDQTE